MIILALDPDLIQQLPHESVPLAGLRVELAVVAVLDDHDGEVEAKDLAGKEDGATF